MNDAEHEDDPLVVEHVVDHPVVPDPEAEEAIGAPTESLHALRAAGRRLGCPRRVTIIRSPASTSSTLLPH